MPLLKAPPPPRPHKPPGTPAHHYTAAALLVFGSCCFAGGLLMALAGTTVIWYTNQNAPLTALGVSVMALGVYLVGAGLCQALSRSRKEAKRCLNWLKNWPPSR